MVSVLICGDADFKLQFEPKVALFGIIYDNKGEWKKKGKVYLVIVDCNVFVLNCEEYE